MANLFNEDQITRRITFLNTDEKVRNMIDAIISNCENRVAIDFDNKKYIIVSYSIEYGREISIFIYELRLTNA